jgi:glutathione peroxidase-family protein
MGFHDFEMMSITGEPVDLRRYAGRFNLIVNVASR